MQTQNYNGWTNYETWLCKLWLDNEEGSQSYWQEEAQRLYDDADDSDETFSKSELAAIALSGVLQDQHEEAAFDQIKQNNGFVHDLLNGALQEVNWHEIATSLIEDQIEEEAQSV